MVEGYFELCEKVDALRCPLAGFKKGTRKTVIDLLVSLHDRLLLVSSDKIVGLVTFYDYKETFMELYMAQENGTGLPKLPHNISTVMALHSSSPLIRDLPALEARKPGLQSCAQRKGKLRSTSRNIV